MNTFNHVWACSVGNITPEKRMELAMQKYVPTEKFISDEHFRRGGIVLFLNIFIQEPCRRNTSDFVH
jgi:hypothetical protein